MAPESVGAGVAVIKAIKQKTSAIKSIQRKLALATCSLLSQPLAAEEEIKGSGWTLDISLLSYEEKDDRISVNKLIANAQGQISDTNRLIFDVVYDTMTGSTPTGAIPIIVGGQTSPDDPPREPIIITSPSGGEPRVIGSGSPIAREITQLSDFEDERIGINVNWQREYARTLRMTYGFSFSDENDFTSTGLSAQTEIDSEQKLSTYTLGVAVTDDVISRVGSNIRVPLSSVQVTQDLTSEENRSTVDLILGYVRVLNKTSLLQLNTSFSSSEGYHTDPYKNISVSNAVGMEVDRLYESRPDSRQRNTVFAQLIHYIERGDDVRLSYRYYTDDWGIDAHTVEALYRYNLKNGHYIEPGVRVYSQSEADFYYRSLPENTLLPQFASADSRLADMRSRSVSFKYGFPLKKGESIRLRLESFDQSFNNAVIKDNRAVIFQLSYKRSL